MESFWPKSWVTGGTKIGPGISSNWRIFEFNWLSISHYHSRQMSARQMSARQMSTRQMSATQMSARQMSATQMSARQMSADADKSGPQKSNLHINIRRKCRPRCGTTVCDLGEAKLWKEIKILTFDRKAKGYFSVHGSFNKRVNFWC